MNSIIVDSLDESAIYVSTPFLVISDLTHSEILIMISSTSRKCLKFPLIVSLKVLIGRKARAPWSLEMKPAFSCDTCRKSTSIGSKKRINSTKLSYKALSYSAKFYINFFICFMVVWFEALAASIVGSCTPNFYSLKEMLSNSYTYDSGLFGVRTEIPSKTSEVPSWLLSLFIKPSLLLKSCSYSKFDYYTGLERLDAAPLDT